MRRIAIGIALTLFTSLFSVTSGTAHASGYYRIQTRLYYNGKHLCLQGNGKDNVVTIATCSTSSRQKWAYSSVSGYTVLQNVGYLPPPALTAPSTVGYAVRLRSVVPKAKQSWLWDSLWNRNGTIYTSAYSNYVLEPRSITPGATVYWRKWAGVTGKQSWWMRPW